MGPGTGQPPRLRSAGFSNYKSLENVRVALERLTVLVGPNGVGKSNLIDALRFVQECLSGTIEQALTSRGGLQAVGFHSTRRPRNVGIMLDLDLPDQADAHYEFWIEPQAGGGFRVFDEACTVRPFMGSESQFKVHNGAFTVPIKGIRPQVSEDRLALYAASATDEFRPVYDFLSAMRFYSIVPDKLRELQDADPGDSLKRDGSNAAAVLKRLEKGDLVGRYGRLCRLLSKVAVGISKVEYHGAGQKQTLRFWQEVGQKKPWPFEAFSMSDGTLRVVGLLLAAYQPRTPTVLGVEEPEATVHPAIVELLLEVLTDAANRSQVLVTTHSPDLLDSKDLRDEQIRVVSMQNGATIVSPMAPPSRQAIQERLYTPGELLRINELEADTTVAPAQATGQEFPPIADETELPE